MTKVPTKQLITGQQKEPVKTNPYLALFYKGINPSVLKGAGAGV
jgi:hypothetical protein